ncbi:hypothetical protein RHSIM_Rhsim06G0218500 [Rhododendron simsii]|uniref:Bromo domain-containing protein n=1 Tax=Rhododendron simsii TaxID=118357 RepID=A0A834GUZ9_RHOSS|nr:hypothetical protein RHSIM_Rhsim06G0218500 [Rhododendron simsii]
MGQIVKRKKKGRPSKADLALRAAAAAAETPEAAERRSLRRRNVRYTFDFDDYVDDDELEDEDAWKREKKLKLLLKLQQQSKEEEGGSGSESAPSRTRLVARAPAAASGSSEEDGGNPLKKRKIGGDVDEDDEDGVNGGGDDGDGEVRGTPKESKGADSVPGTPSAPPLGFALPDKKLLELILDKLQKKDIYGVYAEPVDPEELPDYHEVIEHPMDFATVRKKLGNGAYSTLEQFESDVFLICANAMEYNAPDTIYYRQARSIEELAQKKFQRLRVHAERSEKELKSEDVTRSDSLAKKQIKKPMNRTAQEPVGSDFSSGATLATPGDLQSGSNVTQAGGFEKLSKVDGPVEGNTSLTENILDKAEDLSSGRGALSRLGRKPHIHNENRRATYNIFNQPESRSESVFTTFDDDMKQLVPVGLNADYSYSRSLARFAATLGPVAWNVASKRIEQGLPPGFKYGRGWVGDYEPLPTPVLMLNSCSPKETALKKDDKSSKSTPLSAQGHPVNVPSLKKGDSSLFGAAITKTTVIPTASTPVREQSVRGANLNGKQPFFCSEGSRGTTTASVNYPQQSPRSRNIEPDKKVIKQAELNCPAPSANRNMDDFVAEKQIPNGDVPASRSTETVSRNGNLSQAIPLKQTENNRKVSSTSLGRNRMVTSPSDGLPNQIVSNAPYFSNGQEQGISDPVQLMRMLAENSQKQQKSLNNPKVDNKSSLVPLAPSSRSEDSINATAAAARAWMSIGSMGSKAAAENTGTHKNQMHSLNNPAMEPQPQVSHKNQMHSLNNPAMESQPLVSHKNHMHSLDNYTREPQPQVSQFRGDFPGFGMHFRPPRASYPLQPFMMPPAQMGNEAQNRPMFFPQLVTADLSRFQVQSPRQSLISPRQQRQKQESVPPDLNLSFQSSGSPGGQSSGVMVDSQQPDLALQL